MSGVTETASIHPDTSLGPVRLTVAEIDRMQTFYTRAIGLQPLGGSDEVVRLGAGGTPLIELVPRPDAPRRPPGTTGLFHVAILVPRRLDLAHAILRLGAAGWSLSGASDHLVSEALYLDDPEGNGIEIYRDRAREEWRYQGGDLQMATLPLNLDGVLDEMADDRAPVEALPKATRIGHVHLQVADLDAAERFYHGILGFDVMIRSYPGALFVSAGGYHHHIGLNTWAGPGAPPPPPGARGLETFDVVLPARAEQQRIEQELQDAGIAIRSETGGLRVSDPSANDLVLRTAG